MRTRSEIEIRMQQLKEEIAACREYVYDVREIDGRVYQTKTPPHPNRKEYETLEWVLGTSPRMEDFLGEERPCVQFEISPEHLNSLLAEAVVELDTLQDEADFQELKAAFE